jgi:hypothetical protein
MVIVKLQGGEFLTTRYVPSVDHVSHQDLQMEVTKFLIANNFIIYDNTYGTNASESIKQSISRRFSATALKIRTMADLFVIHKIHNSEFFLEIKTHESKQYNDLCIELFPLLCHLRDCDLDIKTLYVFKVSGVRGGFWVKDLPKIRQIFFPQRIEYSEINFMLKEMVIQLLQGVPIIDKQQTNGSGDPFCIIDNLEIRKCLSWDKMILNSIAFNGNINIVELPEEQPQKVWDIEGDLWD